MRCQPCQNLSLSRLITLAEDEFTSAYDFHPSSYYRHHTSIHALKDSARSGCELCSLLLKALPSDDDGQHSSLDTEAVSDIRIAISSSHVSSNHQSTSDDVHMFDFLLVRAGDRYSSFYYPGLLLLSPPGTVVGQYLVGRDILDSRISAPSNFAIMRRWLDECTSKHQGCSNLQQDALLPTRMIDVGAKGADPFLLVSDGTARGRYAALTHCWGGSIDFVLTDDKLEDFQHRIPVENLAKNFQDAIHICRELGVQHLWIDSLCIIQNSDDDWAAQSSKMTSVYSNAFVTISALASSRSSDGIFRDDHARGSDDWGFCPPEHRVVRDPSLGVSIPLDSSPQSSELVYALRVASDYAMENLRDLYEDSLLTTRAWCLQESLLSQRIIYFGEEQIYWRCFDGFQAADGLPLGNGDFWPDTLEIRLAHSLQGFSVVDLRPAMTRWYKVPVDDQVGDVVGQGGCHRLIRKYSQRNLTKPCDRLPAFSALAERMHAKLGGDYLAGVFTANLHSELLWSPKGPSWLDEMEDHESPAYVAPSWSWASFCGEVGFSDFNGLKYVDDTAPPRHLRLIESKIRYRDEKNPYGQVLPGSSIIVTGLTTRLVLSKQVALGSEGISGHRPKGMCVSRLHWDRLAGEPEKEQVIFAVSSRVSEGQTSAQESRGFCVATKDIYKSKENDWDMPQPEDCGQEVSILPEHFMEDEFLLLLVTPENFDRYRHAECLILEKAYRDSDICQPGHQASAYRKVGTITLSKFYETADWEEMTLELI